MHFEGGYTILGFFLSKTIPNILLSSLNYSGSLTKTFMITFDFLPGS
jgi:hypothetical protein